MTATLHIDRVWRDARAGATRDVVNPFDQSIVAKVAEADADDARDAVAAARRAFDDGSWPHTSGAQRGALLAQLADLLQRDREQVARLETLDTGKTLVESRIDVDDVTGVLRYYAEQAGRDHTRTVDSPLPDTTSAVVREPVGVCSLIAPWNYPLLQASWKIAPALAAGNTIVVKPSELTPMTTARLFELIDEVGFPPGVANLVLGAGPTVGNALVVDERVDLVSFTGGIATGKAIMRSAADTVKKVALELGGCNPNVVFADADFDTAVDYALLAVFLHAGQVCSAGARLLVADAIHDEFVAAVVERAGAIRLGNGLEEGTESGPLISAEHRAKVAGYVEAGREEGAEVAVGGRVPDAPDLQAGFFYLPTVLTGCTAGMRVVSEEIFGPVLTVERFVTEDEAVARANDTIYGLAGAVWTSDAERARRVTRRLRLGTVWVNDYHPYFPQAEWGGFKQSGVGRELGLQGLEEYTEAKHVFTNLRPRPSGWFKHHPGSRGAST
ncbi:MAG: aldehyde dehydrogenase family protein [Egibacteraceae bacterium]